MEFVEFSKTLNIPEDYMSSFVEKHICDASLSSHGRLDVSHLIDETIIDKLRCFLSKKGYKTKNYYVELHSQNNKNTKYTFPWHVDSYGAISETVVSFLYYHYMTPNVKGGDLLIKDYTREKWWIFDYKKYNTKKSKCLGGRT